MVKNVEETINTENQMLDMLKKLKIQLEEYKKNRSNFPKDSDGMYILLEGAITVKNNFNSDDPEGVLLDAKGEKKFPPHELYPKQSTSDRHKTVVKNDRPEIIDAIGDIVVVLTNLAALEGLHIEDCIESAYDVIINRKGKMINGTFVKNN